MPIYEYSCQDCRKSFSFLVGVGADADEPQCPRCGGKHLFKLISRIARIKSKGAALNELGDLDKVGDLEDPRAMAHWAKKMGKALGEETGEDYEEKIDEMLDNPEAAEDLDEE
ncbi:MAG: zinc ribbon domain-containing protein [Deltaproteobacteria bacterium]|nr:MAG: zinc ribbon domain-containing protein [Deltaproteobacteria bacterium]